MVYVFISHSKKDKELVRVIDLNFRSIGVIPLFMEFTPESEPPYIKIEESINLADAIFLFLTQNVKSSDYTQNWISFEVSLTKKSNKPFFVVEDYHNQVHFPVPYLTDYILYEQTKIDDWKMIQNLLQNLREVIENNKLLAGLSIGGAIIGALLSERRIAGALGGGVVGAVLGGLLLALRGQSKIVPIRLKCPECKIWFNFYSKFNDFPCPSCRTELKIGV